MAESGAKAMTDSLTTNLRGRKANPRLGHYTAIWIFAGCYGLELASQL